MGDKFQQTEQTQGISLNFKSDSLLNLTDKIKSSIEGRMDWGDTFGVGLSTKNSKYLLVWTPKKTSEGKILPGFDSEDGKLTLKMKPRPGAWVSWIDEAKVAEEAVDDYDRVRKSVQELERNTRQMIDFADGVLKDITVLHLGKPLTLSELALEILEVELTIPTTIKIGGYVLSQSQSPDATAANVIIPEQTNIHRIHMNEDALFEAIGTDGYDQVLVVYRTHIKRYPDLLDINYCLALNEYFDGGSPPEDIVSNIDRSNLKQSEKEIETFPTAAIYDPLQPDSVQFVAMTFNASSEQIRETITQCSTEIDSYVSKANQRASEVMANFQGRIDSRVQALSLRSNQRVYEKIWDEIANHELQNRMVELIDFFGDYFGEKFEPDLAAAKKDQLKTSIDSMIQDWQLQDLGQTTLKQLILTSYKLANHVLDRATAMFYDLAFEKHFIQPGKIKPVKLQVLEDGKALNRVHLPEWTKKTVRDRLHLFALKPSVHPNQIERLRALWLEFLEIANFASRNNQQFDIIMEPLVDILLSPKPSRKTSADRRRSRAVPARRKPGFEGFEISDEELSRVLRRVRSNSQLIERWILSMPEPNYKNQQHHATLWMILTDGIVREMLYRNFQPTCDINLSLPIATKRLVDIVLGGQVVVCDEKDLKPLKRNLDRALSERTGHGLPEISTPSTLKIHSDTLLCLLYEKLAAYRGQLEKRLAQTTNAKSASKTAKSKKGRKKQQSKTDTDTVNTIESEISKTTEIITFLTPYTDAAQSLLQNAVNPRSQHLNQIRQHQVLNFDLQALPPIAESWLEDVKSLEDYTNLRAFLLENQLPISTTGRLLMNFRRSFENAPPMAADSVDDFDVALNLIQELKSLQDTGYAGETFRKFKNYIAEKLWRWELTQITGDKLAALIKEKVLVSVICYEKDVETLLEYAERYEQLVEAKFNDKFKMHEQAKMLEEKFIALAKSIL
ncbi:MAG: hypothetical protein OXP71_03230 [Candidatus Poribacteria bacterium]|nr:hypothetical protein [Candidatus Poribacteria bacterium]